jgi:hypothetical protein
MNAHIIIGQPRRCVCGVYDGTPIGCREVLASLEELVRQANIKGSGPSLYAHDILRLEAVIRPLVEDCDDIPNPDECSSCGSALVAGEKGACMGCMDALGWELCDVCGWPHKPGICPSPNH